MAELEIHRTLAKQLHIAFKKAIKDGDWPIVVDAGFYFVFHEMEAFNAFECRDSYTFADAADILENVLCPRWLSEKFVHDYRYLFYFRRGALYGTHFPKKEQLDTFIKTSEEAYSYISSILDQQLAKN
jgi:hypothetical protein